MEVKSVDGQSSKRTEIIYTGMADSLKAVNVRIDEILIEISRLYTYMTAEQENNNISIAKQVG